MRKLTGDLKPHFYSQLTAYHGNGKRWVLYQNESQKLVGGTFNEKKKEWAFIHIRTKVSENDDAEIEPSMGSSLAMISASTKKENGEESMIVFWHGIDGMVYETRNEGGSTGWTPPSRVLQKTLQLDTRLCAFRTGEKLTLVVCMGDSKLFSYVWSKDNQTWQEGPLVTTGVRGTGITAMSRSDGSAEVLTQTQDSLDINVISLTADKWAVSAVVNKQ